MRKRAFPRSGDRGCRICRRRGRQLGWDGDRRGPSSVITIATALPDPDTPQRFPGSSGFASLRGIGFPFVCLVRVEVIVGTADISWRGSDFEHRRAFNSFECGDVPSLDLAIEAVGYVAVEVANSVGMEIDGGLHP